MSTMSSEAHKDGDFYSFASAMLRVLDTLTTSTASNPECCSSTLLTALAQLEFLEARLLGALEGQNHSHSFTGVEACAPIAQLTCAEMGSENSNVPASLPVFQWSTKNGEARELKLADLSPLFGLLLADAAKELGMSKTSLKKACRLFGIERWPGRKVRRLESAIDRIKKTMVDHGADAGLLWQAKGNVAATKSGELFNVDQQ